MLRSTMRLTALVFWLLVCIAHLFLTRPRTTLERATWMCSWSRFFVRWMRITVDTPTPPLGRAFVSNHLSYLDVIVLGAQQPSVFLCKADVKSWPLVSTIVGGAGTIFVERERRSSAAKAAEQLHAVMQQGVPVVFFPEGTSTDGTGVLPFRAPIFEAIVESNAQAWPMYLHYDLPGATDRAETVRNDICYWGDHTFATHIFKLLRYDGITARIRYAPQPIEANNRREAAERSHDAVVKMMLDA
jgi:1-acyl-sn-glycerol-3-phosphate acyltransferase